MNAKEKILELCKERNITVHKLEMDCGFGNGSIKRASTIKAERLQKIAQYFDVSLDYLLDNEPENPSVYYLSPEAAAAAQALLDRPELKILFDAARDVSKEDIEAITQIVERMKKG